MRLLWVKFDSLALAPGCDCAESRESIEFMERLKLLQFLMGFSESYEQARSQILMMIPLLTVNKAYSMLMEHESQRAMSNHHDSAEENEVVALMSTRTAGGQFRPKKNYNLQCDFCKMKGHTRENCYKIVGYTADFKHKRSGGYSSANSVMIEEANPQMQGNMNIPNMSSHAEKDNSLGYGIEHIFIEDQFNQILKLLNKEEVQETTANMASVFFPGFCMLQDLYTGKLKGIGKEANGLYLLTSTTSSKGQGLVPQSMNVRLDQNTLQLWHRRMGHPSSRVMKHVLNVIEELCRSVINSCEICPIAKQAKLPFPTSSSRIESVFELLHIDVWGPF
uniref:GAG-pre-integrase domain-containing protein n=1 Tax=Nicotiana tabacum TaxID=4097 RepID=A0A1S4D4Q3_TOBAC|nr:PREDICTED: uncharacterized protein LOC107825855 [Nicotiana tabacum]